MKTRNNSKRVSISLLFSVLIIVLVNIQVVAQTCDKQTASTEKKSKAEVIKEAAEKGDLVFIKKLIEKKGVDVNMILPDKHTMLMYAAWEGHAELANYLLDKGADITVVNDGRNTAFHDAVYKGHKEIAEVILEKGADINQKGMWGFSPLHMACYKQKEDLVEFLIKNGADINQADDNGRPAIMACSWNGNPKIMKTLIKHGADVNYSAKWKNSVLHNLARNGSIEAVKLVLSENVNTNVIDKNNMLPIHCAVQNQHNEIVNMLAQKTKNINHTEKHNDNGLMHLAALNGDLATTKILLKAGADPKLTNKFNETPIDLAIKYAHLNLLNFFIEKQHADKNDYQVALKNKNLASQPVSPGEARTVYSGQSGWIIQTSDKVLVFDYWNKNKPKEGCLANGSFCTQEMKDKDVYVFVSHAHGDHYDPIIHTWVEDIKNIHYIYGFNPNKACVNKKNGYNGPKFTFIENNSTQNIAGVEVTTIKSNDTGQGFLVIADGVSIYHPGDHTWFSEEDENVFKKEVDFISSINNQVDIVFQPVIGCPGRWKKEFIVQGFNYSLGKLNPKTVYPMHAFQREHVLKEFEELAESKTNLTQVVCTRNTGDNHLSSDAATANK